MIQEYWNDVVDYEDYYAVSSLGIVYSKRNNRNLRPVVRQNGYHYVELAVKGINRIVAIHTLVATAFFGIPPKGYEVNHKNGDKSDNSVDNLEWVSHLENMRHAIRTGLKIAGRPRRKVKIVETRETFESIRECAIAINGNPSAIVGCLNGRHSHHLGLHFERVE